MANRIAIYDGYGVPAGFAGKRRKKRSSKSRSRGGAKKQQSKMKSCAVKWKRSGKRGSYRSFMKGCLKK